MIGIERLFNNPNLRSQFTTDQIVLYSQLYFEDFLNILEKFPEDLEKYKQLKHEVEVLDSFNRLNLTCHLCKTSGHIETQCPLINATFWK